jgi:hypothetical protein
MAAHDADTARDLFFFISRHFSGIVKEENTAFDSGGKAISL